MEFLVDTFEELINILNKKYGKQRKVLDIGCGIRPFSWLDSEIIVCIEPFDQYRAILSASFSNEGLVALKGDLASAADITNPADYDLVTLIDVIEHLPKQDGITALKRLIDTNAELIMVFTPDGFMPQHTEEEDAWGLKSGTQQAHLSGWDRADFDALGFNEYIFVKDLHVEDMGKWNGLLAIRDVRDNNLTKIDLWDPDLYPNSPPEKSDRVVVFGRHNRFSGTVVGTHQQRIKNKYYVPSLRFLPSSLMKSYKLVLSKIIRLF
jgi:hypothetical protein